MNGGGDINNVNDYYIIVSGVTVIIREQRFYASELEIIYGNFI